MLEAAAVPFATVSSPFDEDDAKASLLASGCDAPGLAAGLAALKAMPVEAGPDVLVLGADSVLEKADGALLNKAATREEAYEQLRGLSGRPHVIHSAAALVRDGAIIWQDSESVTLTMRNLSDAFLTDYLDREWEDVRWNVGVYRIEGMGAQLFDRIEGSHFAILGLPLIPLLAALRHHGVVSS